MVVLIILILYLLINLWLGIRASRKSAKENSDKGFLSNYFVGSRSMGGVVLAMTLVATYTSASSFLGGPGLASSFGMSWSWVAGVQIGAAFLTLGVLGKKFAMISRRTNSVTINDYLRARYDSPAVVIICGVAMVIFFITQMIAQFIGGATLLQSVTGLPYWAGLLLFGAVVIIYTSVG
ncbi:MAG: sodium/panthothenate symporter, partial [Alcaligenaceae bacterium]|nr:sodium/panthothenate symporter [Alcaligenaceae bacterium]